MNKGIIGLLIFVLVLAACFGGSAWAVDDVGALIGMSSDAIQETELPAYFKTSPFSFFMWFNLFLIAYYLCCALWLRRGKVGGVVVPLFEPPAHLSPAVIAYILDDKNGIHRGFYAAIINLAVKGYLTISVRSDEAGTPQLSFLATARKDTDSLPVEEKILYDGLFYNNRTSQTLSPDDSLTPFLLDKFRLSLVREHSGSYRHPDIISFIGGVLLSFLALYLDKIFSYNTIMYYALFIPRNYFEIIFLFLVNISGFYLCLRRTGKASRLMPALEGFRLYLSLAEKDRLDKLGAPRMTAQVFEKNLPYAIAMNVVSNWHECFETIMEDELSGDYSPSWYEGDASFFDNFSLISSNLALDFGDAVLTAVKSYNFAAPLSFIDGKD